MFPMREYVRKMALSRQRDRETSSPSPSPSPEGEGTGPNPHAVTDHQSGVTDHYRRSAKDFGGRNWPVGKGHLGKLLSTTHHAGGAMAARSGIAVDRDALLLQVHNP